MKKFIYGGIFGLAIGDALGVPVEFMKREDLKKDKIKDMLSYGINNKPAGTWSDDTSMALATMDSLKSGLDYYDIMDKFLQWFLNGKYTPDNVPFGIGKTTLNALIKYKKKNPPLECGGDDIRDNGNGSLMRILPILFFLRNKYGKNFLDKKEAFELIHNISALTHRHNISKIGCGIYISIGNYILDGENLEDAIYKGIDKAFNYYENDENFKEDIDNYSRLKNRDFYKLGDENIKSSGYVVDTLEASIWVLLNTKSFDEAVLKAVNLGDDTDTVAAVTGGLAGMNYGFSNIKNTWMENLVNKNIIINIINEFEKSLK